VRILFTLVGGRCHLEPLLGEIDLDVVPILLGDGVCGCSTTWAKRPSARTRASREPEWLRSVAPGKDDGTFTSCISCEQFDSAKELERRCPAERFGIGLLINR
jgi:hypothetical protein